MYDQTRYRKKYTQKNVLCPREQNINNFKIVSRLLGASIFFLKFTKLHFCEINRPISLIIKETENIEAYFRGGFSKTVVFEPIKICI